MHVRPETARVLTGSAKIQVALGPYLGEKGWQLAGAPDRELFEPLQHVGNMGMGTLAPVLVAGIMGTGMMIAHRLDGANYTPNPIERAERALTWRKKMHTRVALPFAMLVSSAAQIYSETIGTGTHDLKDLEYGLGATGVALAFYHILRQGDFRTYEFEIDQLKANSPHLNQSSTSESQKYRAPAAVSYEIQGLSRKEARRRAAQDRAAAKKEQNL